VTPKDGGTDGAPDQGAPDVGVVDSGVDAPIDASADDAEVMEASLDAAADAPPFDSGLTVLFSGLIVASGPSAFALTGAQVCVAQTTNCSTTDSQGAFALHIPANAHHHPTFRLHQRPRPHHHQHPGSDGLGDRHPRRGHHDGELPDGRRDVPGSV
jgi:hypothetical protein